MIHVGKKIKDARKFKRITQEDLADAIGVSDKSISAYESNRARPPLHVLEKIALATGKPLHFFVEETVESSVLSKLKEVEEQFKEIKKLLKKEKII